ncbi:J domain-containing protein, partial [Mesorhizobium sp. M7A.T.Ca.TU.009.01.3.2]
MAEAYPLHWPAGWPRTKSPKSSRFDVSMAQTRDGLFAEIARLGGRYVVLSTNVPLRQDGLPYANRAEPMDSGVAVYFERKGKQMVFACDQWTHVKDNIRAIEKTIEAMRGIERWGASDMLERAFSAFEALPAPGSTPKREWWQVLGVPKTATKEEITAAYRKRAAEAHPDTGGSPV